ncbi:hypothetical protein nbrc107696_28670 [Gordonia spumicola]|uniref:Uncharacterized protein n=1 Tax=Gordonia spumicola TaxID=589161 RepID=A0A7I9VBB1_9ACTN|nr:hypothetical protein [Gordonia spumicola]GEE02421.1 hypothetical protein nbrc107696_28670 [Gordonia spumicola]
MSRLTLRDRLVLTSSVLVGVGMAGALNVLSALGADGGPRVPASFLWGFWLLWSAAVLATAIVSVHALDRALHERRPLPWCIAGAFIVAATAGLVTLVPGFVSGASLAGYRGWLSVTVAAGVVAYLFAIALILGSLSDTAEEANR